MTLDCSSDSSRDNYKLQQTEEVEKSCSLSEKTVAIKPGPHRKRACKKAEKNGSEE